MSKIMLKENMTPEHLRCIPGSCPAIYALNNGDVLIIGKKPVPELEDQIANKVADDESAITISFSILQEIIK